MNETVSIAKLQSQVDKMIEAMTETETGKRMWEEIQRKQKREDIKKAKSIIKVFQQGLDENIERLQTCQRILNFLKNGNEDEMTSFSFDRLEEHYEQIKNTIDSQMTLLDELEFCLKY